MICFANEIITTCFKKLNVHENILRGSLRLGLDFFDVSFFGVLTLQRHDLITRRELIGVFVIPVSHLPLRSQTILTLNFYLTN